MIKVAVLGYGNIGSGVVSVLLNNKEKIEKQIGEEIVPACVLDLRDFPGDIMEKKVVKDINQIVNDPEISVVVETMGGTIPAYSFVKKCLLAGKHVATSNKMLVAAYGAELLKIAKENHVNFMFEASVGGAIPIIRPLATCITADEIVEITGILNGTTNFMLTSMAEEGCAYEDILKRAQELGYAERNPEADVEGYDACRKIAILASIAYGKTVHYENILTEGITKITADDMDYAKKLDCPIKLFGTCRKEGERVFALVSPVMVGRTNPLYSVSGVMNAILVRGKMTGDLMFYGAGAGKLPTATAVVADVISAIKHGSNNEIAPYGEEALALTDAKEEVRTWFIRIQGAVNEGILTAFGASDPIVLDGKDEFGLFTSPMSQNQLEELMKQYPVLGRIRTAK